MAKIQTLKNKDDVIVYPQTHGTAVFVNEGEILQDKINSYLTTEEVGEVENVDITAELTSNKVTSIRDTSTDSQYPSAKAVYDFVSNAETGVKIEIYASKEAVAAPNGSTIYLIGAAAPYEEYLYLEDTATWELIGNASVDLSGYYTKTEVDTNFATKDKYGDTTINVGRKSGTTTGEYSAAIGLQATASGKGAFATSYNTASGSYAVALGVDSVATAYGSVAQGQGVTASRAGQTAAGTYNIADAESAFIVGNGVSGAKSNAHTVGTDGTGWFQGDVYVGSTSGINKDEGSKKLATESYVDNAVANAGGEISNSPTTSIPIYSIWTGTQEQYEAITTLDANTIYNIIEE